MLILLDHLLLASIGLIAIAVVSMFFRMLVGTDAVMQYRIQTILVLGAALMLPLQVVLHESLADRESVLVADSDESHTSDGETISDFKSTAESKADFVTDNKTQLRPSLPMAGGTSEDRPNRSHFSSTTSVWFRTILLCTYLTGVFVCLLVLVFRLWKTARVIAKSSRVPRTRFGEPAALYGQCRFAVFESEEIAIPSCVSIPCRAILLPVDFSVTYTAEEQKCILMHESVHLQRHDWAICWLQQFLLTAFWFHPLARKLSSRLDEDRELSCDAIVVRKTQLFNTYANALLAGCQTKTQDLIPSTQFSSRISIKRRLDMLSIANQNSSFTKTTATTGLAIVAAVGLIVSQACLLTAAPPKLIFSAAPPAPATAANEPSNQEMSAEIIAPSQGRSAAEMLEHFKQGFLRAGHPLANRITNNETVVSTENGHVEGNTISAKSFYLNLPEGSGMKARLFGSKLLIVPGEKTGFVIEHGAIEIVGPDGIKRFTARAADGRLKIAASIQAREVVFELSAETADGDSAEVRVELDIKTGIKKYDGDAPHGHISYSLQEPNADSDDPIRVKMHWAYETEKLKVQAKADERRAAADDNDSAFWASTLGVFSMSNR